MKQRFINGIYNYCDRWCERCTFTSRCRNYESTSKLLPEQLDIHNKAFWENISSNFRDATRLLHKIAAEQGINLDAISQEETKKYKQRQSLLETAAEEHPLSKLCEQYREKVMPFLNRQIDTDLVDKTRELVSQLHMGMETPEGVVYTMANLRDCEEIIRWYLFFIDVKLQRALHGKMEGEDWKVDNGFQKDSDGSAKIAIISIERSVGAWKKLFELMPASEDVALHALALLLQLKRRALDEFPGAMEFKRPGFDEADN